MARELLAEARIPENTNPNDAYAAAANVALGKVTERWAKGVDVPGEETHVRNVHLKNSTGELIGFRLYLVWDETPRYGSPEIEALEDKALEDEAPDAG